MRKLTGIFLLLFGLAALPRLQAADSLRFYYKKSRLEHTIGLLNQQIVQNSFLPKGNQNFIIDGRKDHYQVATFDEEKHRELNEYLQEISKKGVDFYIIIPPPLLVEVSVLTELEKNKEGKEEVVTKVNLNKYDKSKLYSKTRDAIIDFTREVFKGSKLNNAQTKGLLLNIDSFIDIDFKKEKESKKQKEVKDIINEKHWELFYPCLVFGKRVSVPVIKEAVMAIRQKTKGKFGEQKKEMHMLSPKGMAELTGIYVSTLKDFILKKGGDNFKQAQEAAQFEATANLDLGTMPFSKRSEFISKVVTYETKKVKSFSVGSVNVSDFAGVFDGKIKGFLEDDKFLWQFLEASNPFQLEIITTSDTSVQASAQKHLSKIKGKTAHQIALERELAPNAVRISMHFTYDKVNDKLGTVWTINFGEYLQVGKDKQTITLNLPDKPGAFAVFMAQGFKLFEAALKELVKELEKLKIKEKVWNDSTLKEPVRTVLPMVAGVYNGLIEELQAVPEDILHMIAFARKMVHYIVDDKEKKRVDSLLSSIKLSDFEHIIQQMIDDEVAKYKNVKNSTYIVGNLGVHLIFEFIKLASGEGLVPVLKKAMKQLKDMKKWKRKKKGDGKKGGSGKGKKKKDGIKVSPTTLVATYLEYNKKGGIKKKTPVGKGIRKDVEGEKLLLIDKLQQKTGKYTKAQVITAIVTKATGTKGLYVKVPPAKAKSTEVGKWALAPTRKYTAVTVKGGTKFTKKVGLYITRKISGSKQTWEVHASKEASNNKKEKPLVSAFFLTANNKENKQALIIKSIKSSGKEDKTTKKQWLNALFVAVAKDKPTDGKPIKKHNISVIVAGTEAGIDMSQFKKLKNSPQKEIDKKGQATLVGGWAANILMDGKKHEYKFTLVQNSNVRFAKTACFVAGTKVWMHDYSQKNIEDVLPEDTVRAFDTAARQEVLGKVTHTMIKETSILIEVYTALDTFRVTPEHPFYVNGKWIQAGKLKKGYRLTLLNHRSLLAAKTRHLPRSAEILIDSIAVKDTLVRVYNFTVERFHNYYVGNVGSLVHNKLCVVNLENGVRVTLVSTGSFLGEGIYDDKLVKIKTDSKGQREVGRDKILDVIYEAILKKYPKKDVYGLRITFSKNDKNDGREDYRHFDQQIRRIVKPKGTDLRKAAKNLFVGRWMRKKGLESLFEYPIVDDDDLDVVDIRYVRILRLNPNNVFRVAKTGDEVVLTPDVPSAFAGRAPRNAGELEDGELYLEINTKREDVNCFLDYGSGGVAFDKIFNAFGGKKNIKAILGVWIYGTNLEQFNAHLSKITTPTQGQLEDAAKSTFTGKKALSRGYTKATIEGVKIKKGKYMQVEVFFASEGYSRNLKITYRKKEKRWVVEGKKNKKIVLTAEVKSMVYYQVSKAYRQPTRLKYLLVRKARGATKKTRFTQKLYGKLWREAKRSNSDLEGIYITSTTAYAKLARATYTQASMKKISMKTTLGKWSKNHGFDYVVQHFPKKSKKFVGIIFTNKTGIVRYLDYKTRREYGFGSTLLKRVIKNKELLGDFYSIVESVEVERLNKGQIKLSKKIGGATYRLIYPKLDTKQNDPTSHFLLPGFPKIENGLIKVLKNGAWVPLTKNKEDSKRLDKVDFVITLKLELRLGGGHYFLSGNKNAPVLAAGRVEIKDGKVVSIDNWSGHFRPARVDLINAIRLMRLFGILSLPPGFVCGEDNLTVHEWSYELNQLSRNIKKR